MLAAVTPAAASDVAIRMLLTGDVMTGRGIDQIQHQSVDPVLYESYVRSAEAYAVLAERANGPIPREVAAAYVWGDVLPLLDRERPWPRIVNLETAITARGAPWPGKAIHYRTHPDNIAILQAAGIDLAVLANNHVLDWGSEGLEDTLATLRRAGIPAPGAGQHLTEATAPVLLESGGVRVRMFAMAGPDSGVPADWTAGRSAPGVHRIAVLDEASAAVEAARIRAASEPGEIVIVSIHWGGNWGWRVPEAHRDFARHLIEQGGVDLVHGHSSHHPMGMEVHRGRLILYGAGDLINDYEGISGHEAFRPDLAALYLPALHADGSLQQLDIVPLRRHRFRLVHAGDDDAAWLAHMLAGESQGVAVTRTSDRILVHPEP